MTPKTISLAGLSTVEVEMLRKYVSVTIPDAEVVVPNTKKEETYHGTYDGEFADSFNPALNYDPEYRYLKGCELIIDGDEVYSLTRQEWMLSGNQGLSVRFSINGGDSGAYRRRIKK